MFAVSSPQFSACPKLSCTTMSNPERNLRTSLAMGSPLVRKTVRAVKPRDSLYLERKE